MCVSDTNTRDAMNRKSALQKIKINKCELFFKISRFVNILKFWLALYEGGGNERVNTTELFGEEKREINIIYIILCMIRFVFRQKI